MCWSFTSPLTLGLNLMSFLQNTWIYQNLVNHLPFGGKEWSTIKMGKCEVLAFLCVMEKGRRKLYLCVTLVEKVLWAKSKWSHLCFETFANPYVMDRQGWKHMWHNIVVWMDPKSMDSWHYLVCPRNESLNPNYLNLFIYPSIWVWKITFTLPSSLSLQV
jgi:hypothetical protein